MKKLCCIVSILILFCCCGEKTEQKIPDYPFSSEITLSSAGKSYEGTLIKNSDEHLELKVMGENLDSPLKFEIKDGGYSFFSGEGQYKTALENAPAASAIVEIKNTLDSLSLGEISREKQEVIITSPLGTVRYNSRNGEFITIKTQNFDVVFKRFEKTENRLS